MMALTAIALAASIVMFSQISQISSAADVTSVCDAGPVVISDSEVHYMTSPNFPSNYSNDLDCWQMIIAPNGGVIKVTVEYAAITDGDNLWIYKGLMRTLLADIKGNVGTPITYNSSNPIVFIQFYTNQDNGNSGFNLTYQVYLQSAGTSAPPSTPTVATSVCDPVLVTSISPGEVYYLTSPNFPSRSDSGLNCWRLILAPNDALIKVTVWNASIEEYVETLIIYEGIPIDILREISGTLEAPATCISSSRFLFIHFVTGENTASLGFNLTYEVYLESAASSASTTTSTTETTSDRTFPSTMITTSSVLTTASTTVVTSVCDTAHPIIIYDREVHYMTSPNFPSNYPNDLRCKQLIIAPNGGGIKVTVEYADIGTDSSLWIFDGKMTLLDIIQGPVGVPRTYDSSRPMVIIEFDTNKDNANSGFNLTYQVYLQSAGTSAPPSTPTVATSVCDEVLPIVLSSGEVYYLTSPNFPSSYSSGLNCWRLMLAPNDALIKVTVWNATLAEGSDTLLIFDGIPSEQSSKTTISDTLEVPVTYISSGRFMFIEYATPKFSGTFSLNLTYEVYLESAASSVLTTASTTSVTTTEAATTSAIQFTQKLSSAPKTTSSSVCDVTNTTTLSAGEVRYLTSPNYPSDYDNNLDCWRLIIAPYGAVIKVTVLYADMEPRYDYLNIYDGMSNSSNLFAGISGTLASPASYNSSGQYLLLHFHTDYNKVNSGFNLTYEVSLPQSASTSVTSTEAATTPRHKCRTITTTPSGYNSATGIFTDHIILCVIASVFVAMMIQTGHMGSVL